MDVVYNPAGQSRQQKFYEWTTASPSACGNSAGRAICRYAGLFWWLSRMTDVGLCLAVCGHSAHAWQRTERLPLATAQEVIFIARWSSVSFSLHFPESGAVLVSLLLNKQQFYCASKMLQAPVPADRRWSWVYYTNLHSPPFPSLPFSPPDLQYQFLSSFLFLPLSLPVPSLDLFLHIWHGVRADRAIIPGKFLKCQTRRCILGT